MMQTTTFQEITNMTTNAPRRLDAPALRELMEREEAPRILDVRTPAEFETTHIPGAYNVPLDNLKEHRDELRRHLDEDVVLVCRSGARATQAEKALAEVGLPGLHVLDGGMVAWEATGAPVNRGRQTWELERQVRLVAGGFGSAAVPKLKWVAAGVGSGLVFAAVSNTCAMGTLLSKMPWNKQAASCDMDRVVRALAEAA
jgi:rhodanese-related sulfurtransferase